MLSKIGRTTARGTPGLTMQAWQRAAGSLTMARKGKMDKIFAGAKGNVPLLWCPVLAHYNDDGTLDKQRIYAHQSWLAKNGVHGFLVPGSTGDAWDMSPEEALRFLSVCRAVATKIREKNPDLKEAPYLLGGALCATEKETIHMMDAMKKQAGDEIFGFTVCPPRGVSDVKQMEASLDKILSRGHPCAVYQLPQVCEVTMPVDVLRRLADKHDTFLLFKDSSGEDATALSKTGLDGVFMVRGAEGKYAEWLANPISSGYHGFLLSTANVYPGPLSSMIEKIAAGANGGDLVGACDLSARLTRVTDAAFGLVTGDLADGLGGNAFTNSAKAVDYWMANGPDALKKGEPLPLLKSGKRLPHAVVEKIGEVLTANKLMPKTGYCEPPQAPLAALADRASVLRGEGAMEFLAKAKILEGKGVDVCHLEIGDPDFDTPKHITIAGELALSEGMTHYEASGGSLKLREAVAKWFKETRPGLDPAAAIPENVLCSPGGKNIIFQTIAALVQKGDEVVYPNPGFPAYETTIEWFGGKPVPLKLDNKTGFRFDHDELKRIVSPKTKLIIVCSPGNPSGGVLSPEDLDYIAEVAKANGAWVLSDEIYSQLVFDGKHDSIATRPGMAERTVVLDGCSKNWAMTGWRVGFGLYPPALIESARNICINTFSCLPPFVSAGAIAAVEGTMEPTDKMRREFMARRDIVFDRLNAIPGVSVSVRPQGAMYLMADVSGTGLSASEFSNRLLFEHGVALLDGAFFGKHGAHLVRISFAQSRERLAEACDRIARFCESVRAGKDGTPIADMSDWPQNIRTSASYDDSIYPDISSVHSLTSLSSYDLPFEN